MTQTKPQRTQSPMLQTPAFVPFFNFNFLDMGFLPTFTTSYGSSSIDEFQKMFFNAINMMEFNIPQTEQPDNSRPLDYNRTNNSYAPGFN